MGRDKLNTSMRNRGLQIVKRRRGLRTTDSNHIFQKYADLAKDLELVRSE